MTAAAVPGHIRWDVVGGRVGVAAEDVDDVGVGVGEGPAVSVQPFRGLDFRGLVERFTAPFRTRRAGCAVGLGRGVTAACVVGSGGRR